MLDPILYNQPARFRKEVEVQTGLTAQRVLSDSSGWPIERRRIVLEWLEAAQAKAVRDNTQLLEIAMMDKTDKLEQVLAVLRGFQDNNSPVAKKILADVGEVIDLG